MRKKRKIAVVTGTRAEYGIFTSVLDAIKEHPKLDYQLVVTGMHLLKEFGYTINEIKKDGYKISAVIPMLKNTAEPFGMAESLGRGIMGMTRAFKKLNPDIVLVLGDRDEPLAAAVAAAHMNIPVGHIHGGEVTGSIDESIRHAITKFSHIHFAATRKSAERLRKMGEQSWRIYLVGSPGVDYIKNKKLLGRKAVAKKFRFNPNKRFILAIQHPVTTEYNIAKQNMKAVLDSLLELNEQTVYIYSNSDAGYAKMMGLLLKDMRNRTRKTKIKVFRNLEHTLYLSLMKNCDLMIGNSSSGLIEAPSCKTPYVLVGTRQTGRERAKSVIQAGYSKREILAAAKRAMFNKVFRKVVERCTNPYDPFGDGKAGKRIANILAKVKIDYRLIQKKIAY